ncbi:hypothetical protein YC2023_058847 [Brassica napus]
MTKPCKNKKLKTCKFTRYQLPHTSPLLVLKQNYLTVMPISDQMYITAGAHSSGLITRSRYIFKLTQSSIFSKIQPINDRNFLFLANYGSIICGLWHPKFYIGYIVLSVI